MWPLSNQVFTREHIFGKSKQCATLLACPGTCQGRMQLLGVLWVALLGKEDGVPRRQAAPNTERLSHQKCLLHAEHSETSSSNSCLGRTSKWLCCGHLSPQHTTAGIFSLQEERSVQSPLSRRFLKLASPGQDQDDDNMGWQHVSALLTWPSVVFVLTPRTHHLSDTMAANPSRTQGLALSVHSLPSERDRKQEDKASLGLIPTVSSGPSWPCCSALPSGLTSGDHTY